MVRIGQGMTRALECLDISGCAKITDAGLIEFGKCSGARHLRHLDLSGLPLVTDAQVPELAAKSKQNLRSLRIANCTKLTIRTLFSLLNRCARLLYLDISGTPQIVFKPDDAVWGYAQAKHDLRKLVRLTDGAQFQHGQKELNPAMIAVMRVRLHLLQPADIVQDRGVLEGLPGCDLCECNWETHRPPKATDRPST